MNYRSGCGVPFNYQCGVGDPFSYQSGGVVPLNYQSCCGVPFSYQSGGGVPFNYLSGGECDQIRSLQPFGVGFFLFVFLFVLFWSPPSLLWERAAAEQAKQR